MWFGMIFRKLNNPQTNFKGVLLDDVINDVRLDLVCNGEQRNVCFPCSSWRRNQQILISVIGCRENYTLDAIELFEAMKHHLTNLKF